MIVNVVIGVLEQDKKILLIKRQRGQFQDMWGLPGGKVEDKEHLDKAIEREIEEETEFVTKAVNLLGVSTEIITEPDKSPSTSIIYCMELESKKRLAVYPTEWSSVKEGMKLRWFTLEELSTRKDIVGSDLLFLSHFYYNRDKNYVKVDCIRHKNDTYTWKEQK